MDYQSLVDAEVAELVAKAMRSPAAVYAAGLEDLTEVLVKIGSTKYTLDEALILGAIVAADEPAYARDIQLRCRDAIRLELAVRAGTLAQDIVDARLDDEQWHANNIRIAA